MFCIKTSLLKYLILELLSSGLLGFLTTTYVCQYITWPFLNWDISVLSRQIYKSLIEYEKWSMERRGEGGRSMIWICMCRLSPGLQPMRACACVCARVCVCVAGSAALLDIWMSNDVVSDWAITTSARLLKRGWRDGERRMVLWCCGNVRWIDEQIQEILNVFHI